MTFAFIVDSVPFTRAVIAGETSLGGSESACLGLARALAKRGHRVDLFTTQIDEDACGPDGQGLTWHDVRQFPVVNTFLEYDVVCALRWYAFFAMHPVHARMRLLWNQDLLVPGVMPQGVMGVAWALDHLVYVSEYHRKQWEQLQPDLAPFGWVTRNGFDPSHLPHDSTKDPNRIIHISRPERGLEPILAMWPALKAQRPSATLQICRYSSMYDAGGWGQVCREFDARVAAMNQQVGGIEYLGELNKPQLYKAISDAAVMWYPGVSTFAETSCIAAVEAQACGTPFVGSYRGALPETVPGGVLIQGHHASPEYQEVSIAAVLDAMEGCASRSFAYRKQVTEGRKHVAPYAYGTIAGEWEQQIEAWFEQRYQANKRGVLKQLLHEDDHVAARTVAEELKRDSTDAVLLEAQQAIDFCDYVIAGKDQTDEQYGAAALPDPLIEAEISGRFKAVVPMFGGCTNVLDVACGNGSFAIALALADPTVRVTGLDYSEANIARARDGAERAGVADRCEFHRIIVYDFERQELHDEWRSGALIAKDRRRYDGLFVGEFIEHVGNYQAVIDGLESVLEQGATVVYTCPHGACAEMVPRGTPLRRGHVHRFHHDDVYAVWGPKKDVSVDYLAAGTTERGNPLGNWLIRYTHEAGRSAGPRPLAARVQRTRPLPSLTVGIIAKNAENDLGRCLASVYRIADQILVGDTGSTDQTIAIAESYGATVLSLPPVEAFEQGFAGARNAVLDHATGDWFLWIDADEQLLEPYLLRRYLDGAMFNGYVLRQTHLYIDGPPTFDIPVRVFRRALPIQFYGCVHEQPQQGDCNGDIYPTLEVQDVLIAHTGYLTPDGRERKRVERNLPLLVRDGKVFPDRILGKVLALREAVLQGDAAAALGNGLRAQQGWAYAVRIFVDYFDDPAHKYHKLARPWYEAAIRHLGIGWEQEIALAGRKGGLEGRHAKPERLWVRDGQELQRLIAFKTAELAKQMAPATFVTNPDDLAGKTPLEAPDPEGVPA